MLLSYKNRTIFDTLGSILEEAMRPICISLLNRITGIRWDKLQEYLEILVENSLIETTTDYENRKSFKTTAKGKRYLDNLNQLKSMIDHKIEKTPLKIKFS